MSLRPQLSEDHHGTGIDTASFAALIAAAGIAIGAAWSGLLANFAAGAFSVKNFTASSYRRVDRIAQIDHSVDPIDAIARPKARIVTIPNITTTPPPDVEILDFNALGTQLAVRPYRKNADYWQVYFDTNRIIHEEFSKAGYAVPSRHETQKQ